MVHRNVGYLSPLNANVNEAFTVFKPRGTNLESIAGPYVIKIDMCKVSKRVAGQCSTMPHNTHQRHAQIDGIGGPVDKLRLLVPKQPYIHGHRTGDRNSTEGTIARCSKRAPSSVPSYSTFFRRAYRNHSTGSSTWVTFCIRKTLLSGPDRSLSNSSKMPSKRAWISLTHT